MAHRRTLLSTFPFLTLTALAQTPFEHADQRTAHTRYTHCAPLGTAWAVCGTANDVNGWGGPSFLRAFSANGDSLWEHPFGTEFGQAHLQGMATAQNGDIVTASMVVDCDVLMPFFLAERISPAGDTVWSRTFPFNTVTDVAVGAGGELAFSLGNEILIAGPDGDSLTSFPIAGSSADGIIWDSDSTLLTRGWNGGLARWSTDGQLLATGAVAGIVADMARWHEHRLVLTGNGMLHMLDAELVIVDSLDLGIGYTYGRLLPLPDRLIVTGNEYLTVLDTSLLVISTVPVDPEDVFPPDLFTAFAANDSMVLMTASPGIGAMSAGLVRSMAPDGGHQAHPENVGISILSVDSVYYYLQGSMVYPLADATVRVTNPGPTVVNDVLVAHAGFAWDCGNVGSSVHVHDAGLAPGGYMDIPMTGLNLHYAPWPFVTLDQPICIAALSPNNLYDRDQSDNYACDTAHIVLGIEDATAAQGLIVQNPFDDAIDLRFPSPVREALQVVLHDATGRRTATTVIPAGSDRLHWAPPGLHDGAYLLRAEGLGAPIVIKLLRQGY